MEKSVIKANVNVPIVGEPVDYINSPIIKDNIAIGVITDCIEVEDKYNLSIVLWQNIILELTNNKPSALILTV